MYLRMIGVKTVDKRTPMDSEGMKICFNYKNKYTNRLSTD